MCVCVSEQRRLSSLSPSTYDAFWNSIKKSVVDTRQAKESRSKRREGEREKEKQESEGKRENQVGLSTNLTSWSLLCG